MNTQRVEYYRKVNRFSEIKKEKWIINKLKNDIPELFSTVKSILIHPIDAKTEKVKYDRRNRGVFHSENSTVETMLSYIRLEKYFSKKILPLNTIPNDRAVLSCDHHALLLTSFLRNLGIASRARTGYCKYIVDGLIVPHWVTEIYSNSLNQWIIIDSERQIEKVEKNDFLFAAEIWKNHMDSGANYSSYSGFSGRQGLKYALLCDLNCIFKNELLSYEWRLKSHNRKKPTVARTSYERLFTTDKGLIDEIAVMLLQTDKNLNELWELYKQIVEERDIIESGYSKFLS